MPDKPNNDYECIEHCWISMHDGVRLSARIWLPELAKSRPAPAILEYIPYRKRDMVRLRDERNHAYFAANGYVSIRVDMRGSGDSEGIKTDMYDPDEFDDAIQVIEWIADQPWCNGKVGMMGTSWGGTASLQAAARRPEALKAIIAVCATNNRFDDDIHHMGGCLLTDTIEWGATLPAILAAPPDSLSVGEEWRDIWQERLEQLSFPLEDWVRHESRDGYWQNGAVNENPEAITCPILAVGGWSDRYSNTVMTLLNDSHDNCWGIVGPWGHHYPDVGIPGPGISFQREALRWWDYWLKGIDNGQHDVPRLRVWLQEFSTPENKRPMANGRWLSEPAWPSSNIQSRHFGFFAGKLISSVDSDAGSLSVPWNLNVGLSSGDTGYFGRDGGLTLDQQADDDLSLCFDSDPLTEPMRILGRVGLRLTVSKSQANGMLAIRLNDVSPAGEVARITYAIRNLVLDDYGQPFPASSDTDTQHCYIEFPNTAYQLAAGHRLRVAVSSAYWPLIWPSPKPVDITLQQESMALTIPMHQNDTGTPVMFDPPSAVKPDESGYQIVSAPDLMRSIYRDDQSGRQHVEWHQPEKTVYIKAIDLLFSFETKASHSIHVDDPNSAKSRFEHRLRFERGDWCVEVIGVAELTSDESTFYPVGSVIVRENGEVVFEREWSPSVLRVFS